jgi:hypothetical protein
MGSGGIVTAAMVGLSVSCLFYLFADYPELGIGYQRRGPQAAIPGSTSTVPLGPLEVLLMRVAFWELVTTGNVKATIDVTKVQPWRLTHPRTQQLNLYRQPFPATSPPSGSLAEQLLPLIAADGTRPTIAVSLWAGERWPLPLDSLVVVAVREALDSGLLVRTLAGTARKGRRRILLSPRTVIPTLEADVDALNALQPDFYKTCADWHTYCTDFHEENQMLEADCRGALYSLRLQSLGSGDATPGA